MTDKPVIPDHLVEYDESRWLPLVEPSAHFPGLRAREMWRRAQDQWGSKHGIWRAEFEQLANEQRAAKQQAQQAARPKRRRIPDGATQDASSVARRQRAVGDDPQSSG